MVTIPNSPVSIKFIFYFVVANTKVFLFKGGLSSTYLPKGEWYDYYKVSLYFLSQMIPGTKVKNLNKKG